MKKIKKAVILTGGFGTRFLPITKAIPKEMLSIIDRPVIDYIVSECLESGIEEVIVVSNNKKISLKNYFETNYSLEKHLKVNKKDEDLDVLNSLDYLKEIKIYEEDVNDLRGNGYALKRIKKYMDDEPFALLYGDDLMSGNKEPVLKQLIDIYNKTGSNVVAVKEVNDEEISKYGIIKYNEDGKIADIIEKPSIDSAPSHDAGLGRYILSGNFFKYLDKLEPNENGQYQAVVAIADLLRNESGDACKFDGTYYDTGSKLGYIKANIDFALKRDSMKDEIIDHINNIVNNKKS